MYTVQFDLSTINGELRERESNVTSDRLRLHVTQHFIQSEGFYTQHSIFNRDFYLQSFSHSLSPFIYYYFKTVITLIHSLIHYLILRKELTAIPNYECSAGKTEY